MPARIAATVNTISVVIGVVTAGHSFYLLPYRMKVNEEAVIAIQQSHQRDHELLVRIDERTARVAEWLRRKEGMLAP